MVRRRSLPGAAIFFALAVLVWPASASAQANVDGALKARGKKAGWSQVIVTLKPGGEVSGDVRKLGGKFGRKLNLINALVVELPNGQIKKLASHPAVLRLDLDRPTTAHMSRVANMVGARYARRAYGYTGAGVGVAVIDSGITSWHDDLTYSGSNPSVSVNANQRVAAFVDFVNGGTTSYDDYGHGTHVSGIIAGNGFDSWGSRAGIAPESHLVSLRVLDNQGRGVISNVIAALDYVVVNRAQHNIRVVNLSVGAAVTTSYDTDPLTLAAKRAVDAGIVVVAAAGNLGRTQTGEPQYGGVTAPGNAPWVLTVGASTHQGTLNRLDDQHAPYSSRGPTAIDFGAKPDIIAPGTGVVSLTSPGSTFDTTKSAFLLAGSFPTAFKPYLSLSGTSMAAPVVSGTVALMMQANPSLTPNLVKAILQYTAQVYPGVDYMTQGGGFLNTKGAVDLARYFATATAGARYPTNESWARAFNWGNHRVSNGAISPFGTAWNVGVTWGAADDAEGDNVVWGTACNAAGCYNVVWGTALMEGDNVVWGTLAEGDNVVWGTSCDPEQNDCFNVVWGTEDEAPCDATVESCDGDNVVWGTNGEGDNVVWGTTCLGSNCRNVVWGTNCDPTVEECYNVVWGTMDECDPTLESCEGDNVVWGTDCDPMFENCEGENVVWGTTGLCDPSVESCDGDNVVWGTNCDSTVENCDGDNVVWGTNDACDPTIQTCEGDGGSPPPCDPTVETCEGDNVVWGMSIPSLLSYFSFLLADIVDEYSWLALFQPPATVNTWSSSTTTVLYTYVFYFGGTF